MLFTIAMCLLILWLVCQLWELLIDLVCLALWVALIGAGAYACFLVYIHI